MTQKFPTNLHRLSKVILFAFVAIMIIGGSGCKSKKKAAEAADAAAEKARIEQQAKLEKERAEEEERRRAEEERLARERAEDEAPARKLETYFSAIANASSVTSANETINEALTLFSSPETPVLIVISEYNGKKDYDRPTTIRQYLNYLKDQKKNMNKIGDLQVNSSGKITKVELVK